MTSALTGNSDSFVLAQLSKFTAQADRAARAIGKDDGALHDFRVALRRIRSWLKAFGSSTGIDAGLAGEVSRLASATNAHRDLEVYAAWLDDQQPKHESKQLHRHARHTRRQLRDVEKATRKHIGHDWPAVRQHICRALETAAGSGTGRSFMHLAHVRLSEHAAILDAQLDEIGKTDEHALIRKRLHKCRINIKQIHYLLDPFRSKNRHCRKSLADLKLLQDELGRFHDLSVFTDTLEYEKAALKPLHVAAEKQCRQQLKKLRKRLQQPPIPWLERLKAAIATLDSVK